MPVLCLIANPIDSELDPRLAEAVVREVGGELNWLNHSIACEIIEPKSTDALTIAREIIASAVRDGGFPPLMLDPVDFVGLYRQNLEREQGQPS